MVAGVADGVDSSSPQAVSIRLLGRLALRKDGQAPPMPASRKVRALLAYLAVAPAPPSREHLCELLWPVPDDPRGELRGCLSKLRALVDSPGRPRLLAADERVWLDTGDVEVDALAIARVVQDGLGGLSAEQLAGLAARFHGEFLEGLELDRCPAYGTWLTGQRRRFRAARVAVLEALEGRLPADAHEQAQRVLGDWLQIAPFDRTAHARLLALFAHRGNWRDGEEHLAAAVRQFEAEALDPGALVDAWRRARGQAQSPALPPTHAPPVAEAPRQRLLAEHGLSPRASIAVMPFDAGEPGSTPGPQSSLAEALVHDVISGLARLRVLFVIAQGTVFALGRRGLCPEEAGRLLHVDYVTAGRVRRQGMRLQVRVELIEVRSARVVWNESFDEALDDTFGVLDLIGQRIVAAIDGEVEVAERQRAMLKPPDSLDAWEAYHRGLWHMYRFRQEDNAQAGQFFRQALQLDPTFARAHAGLSFTHFQQAFQQWGEREPEVAAALACAGQSLAMDDRDPAAHWAMGRALWLAGETPASLDELQAAVGLSPNFAQGHYSLAFVHSQSGDPEMAIRAADQSRQLSPFDPMLFAMLGARAMALVRLGRLDEAADFAARAATRPNAHAHVLGIAAHCLALAGRMPEARRIAAAIRRQLPDYSGAKFLAAFHFSDDAAGAFGEAARKLGW
ncbi:transcriptional regulator [Variovorax sp.]|uniref:transcriptional regulator n=1 Tax=Variovorax sp. TaxID=1871043 RepID=UPI002D2DE82B|nr:transcriptional regulator [Variovorax sp.]HYP83597.1 transcriptional regulator [Variovorax sp.]